jgi:hypothetical protein
MISNTKEEYDKLKERLEAHEAQMKENYFKHRDRIKRLMEKQFGFLSLKTFLMEWSVPWRYHL